jgi:hypothetical protein
MERERKTEKKIENKISEIKVRTSIQKNTKEQRHRHKRVRMVGKRRKI